MPRQGKRSPKPSAKVAKAITEADWDPICDGLAAAYWFKFETRPGRGPHRVLKVLAGEREVEVCISPTGQSVRVFVDHDEVLW